MYIYRLNRGEDYTKKGPIQKREKSKSKLIKTIRNVFRGSFYICSLPNQEIFLIAGNILLVLPSQEYQKPILEKWVLGPQLFQLKLEGLLKLF